MCKKKGCREGGKSCKEKCANSCDKVIQEHKCGNSLVPITVTLAAPVEGPLNIIALRHAEDTDGAALRPKGIERATKLVNFINKIVVPCYLTGEAVTLTFAPRARAVNTPPGTAENTHSLLTILPLTFHNQVGLITPIHENEILAGAFELHKLEGQRTVVLIWEYKLLTALLNAFLGQEVIPPWPVEDFASVYILRKVATGYKILRICQNLFKTDCQECRLQAPLVQP